MENFLILFLLSRLYLIKNDFPFNPTPDILSIIQMLPLFVSAQDHQDKKKSFLFSEGNKKPVLQPTKLRYGEIMWVFFVLLGVTKSWTL